jgi:DNA polymerase-3 subunit gamma/tau
VAQLLSEILHKEGIAAEPAALRMLGQAARGSMRDGLSLLDQAIAYGAGSVTLEGVRGMLGAIDTTVLVRLLDALAARDGKALLALADEMAARSLSFAQGLRDLASLLHRITLAQQVPESLQDADNAADLARLARQFAADELQLYYQVALHGRNDLHLAPDEYAGFTMTLLRMLAFAPSTTAGDTGTQRAAALVAGRPQNPARPIRLAVPAPAPAPAVATARPQPATPAATAPTAAPDVPARAPATLAAPAADVPLQCADWPTLAAQLPVAGLARELAARSELVAIEGDTLRLRVALKTLADQGNVERLKNALSQHFGRPLRLRVEVGSTAGPTATALAEQARAERHTRAEAAIYADPFVQQVMKELGATVDPASIRPVGPE